ncbi:hypothetical protein [Pseudobacteroides cellulosolvens]|uniref:Lipoprotein n=1 Tax=Pseudobacteroides cellulosolvens ATCC 35603 = DSM 2933 TaxID=398512 RepID=A0A0L6JYL3_9FIRM|nr:hypothetical protein [Pseudobacteroides cellulosolvens]KNY30605.1 hypothetical protein Bccel_5885 [Pseudobacteroides cellulosolvens ATCC 35603 = DSM 2933]
MYKLFGILFLSVICIMLNACNVKEKHSAISTNNKNENSSMFVPEKTKESSTSTLDKEINTPTINTPRNTLSENKNNVKDKIIDDTSKWNHPTRDVFEKYSYHVDKLEFLKDGVYPVFYISINDIVHNCMEINSLDFINELAKANGFWSFEIITKEEQVNQPYEYSFFVNKLKVICDNHYKRVEKFYEYIKRNEKEEIYENILTEDTTIRDQSQFELVYKGFKINKNTTVDEVIKKIGTGTADESNNYGYIGVSGDVHYARMSYPKDIPIFDIVTTGGDRFANGSIAYLDITDTKDRLVNKGNTYDELFECYGGPNWIVYKNGMLYKCKVFSKNGYKEYLEFDFSENQKIERVLICYR